MGGSRVALVIANSAYSDPGLSQLRAPARDAAALAAVLGDPEVGGFDVRVLENKSAQEIRRAIEGFFANRLPEDLLLLHFSCHGLKNAGGELFLAVADTEPAWLASTAVPADFVNQQMAGSRAQGIALFLDCCYGGAFERGWRPRAAGDAQVRDAFAGQDQVRGGRGRVVVTASSAMEYAFEEGELTSSGTPKPSVFTSAVVDGLTSGAADKDGDGWVGLTELVDYVTDQVHRITPSQNPQMWTFGSQGELLIARSNRITPRALAPELLEAMASPLPAARFGVVDYLRERLTSADQGLAYAAYQALTQMTNDDSRKVSEAASRALTNAPPTLQDLVLGSVAPVAPEPAVTEPDAAPPVTPPSYAAQQHAIAQGNQQRLKDIAHSQPQPKPASTATRDEDERHRQALVAAARAELSPKPAAAPASIPWWAVAVLVVGAVLLVIVNWPWAVDTRRIWSDDSNTGWRVYRSWFDPEIVASVVVLVAALAARRVPVAMGIALGAVLSIGEDAFLILAGGLAAEETAEWLVAGFIALILAVTVLVVLRPQPRPWPVRAPAFALIVAGGIVLLLGTMIQHSDGISFSTVTKLALLEPFVVVVLGWLAIAAIEERTRTWLIATVVTYAVISMIAAVPALTEGKSAPDLLAGLLGNLLVIAGVAYAARHPWNLPI